MSTVTALVRCHEDGPMVARLVELVRPWVAEVLVVADERMPAGDLRHVEAVAPDRLLRIAHSRPNERAHGYVHRQASGDWILRLCGDEMPSLALLGRLEELVAAPRVTHYRIPIAWLWPDLGHALDERPWAVDHQPRLVRADPALLHFPGRTHSGLTVHGPAHILTEPIYHLDLAITDLPRRRAKADRYERENPGLTVLGRPLNAMLYLPEERDPAPTTATVEAADRAALRRMVDPPPRPAAPAPAPERPVVGLEALDAHWVARPVEPTGLRAEIRIVERDLRCAPFARRELTVELRNRGAVPWPWSGEREPVVRLAHRWHRADGYGVEPEAAFVPLPGPVAPGGATLADAWIEPPPPGRHRLEVGLVHAEHGWLEAPAAAEVDVPVTAPRRRLLALVPFKDEIAHLPGLLENLEGQVDGIVALDDGSTDGSEDLMAAHPSVLELLRRERRDGVWDDAENHRRLVQAAWEHDPDWLYGIDADERVERDFRARADLEIQRAEAEGHGAYFVHVRELWDRPDRVRIDGQFGLKVKAPLFRARRDHRFDERRLHCHWAPLNDHPDGVFPQADLIVYHLAMLHPQDRRRRKARYETIDADRGLQAEGYAYMTATEGLELAPLPPGRDFIGAPP